MGTTTNRKTAMTAAVLVAAAGLVGSRAAHAASFSWDGSNAANSVNYGVVSGYRLEGGFYGDADRRFGFEMSAVSLGMRPRMR